MNHSPHDDSAHAATAAHPPAPPVTVPRYQLWLFLALLGGSVLMAGYLVHLRHGERERLRGSTDNAPMIAPSQAPMHTVMLVMASDHENGLSQVNEQMQLPESLNAQARVILVRLLAEYSKPLSPHKLPAGASVDDVFLLPVGPKADPQPYLAVINLDRHFADSHPAGEATESLTLRSMLDTLHANIPQITQVRFLVEGQPRETLAGHANLRRVYLLNGSEAQTE